MAFQERQRELCHSFDVLADAMKSCAQVAANFSKYVAALPPPDRAATSPDGNDALPDGKGKRKRATKLKKEKDPDAPKRPSSAYLHFQNDVRSWFKEKNPGVPYSTLVEGMSKKWKELTPSEKEKYNSMVEEDKKRFARETEEYKARKGLDAENTAPNPKGKAKKEQAPKAAAVPAPQVDKLKGKAVESSSSGEESEDSDSVEQPTAAAGSRHAVPAERSSESEEEESSEEEAPPPPKKQRKGKASKA